MSIRVTYKSHTYEAKSEAALVALIAWLTLRDVDERMVA
jgi:hypothetical protein